MRYTFNSQIYIGNKTGNILARIICLVLAASIILAVGIKILVGDFNLSDISGIIMALIIISVGRNNAKPKPQYAFTQGNIEFEQEKMIITYVDVNGGKKLGYFSETVIVQYDDIKIIEYGKELNCYRIVARCDKKRTYLNYQKEYVMSNREKEIETFIYIMDEEIERDIRETMQLYSGQRVHVLE